MCLNKKVNKYQVSKCEFTFNDIFRDVHSNRLVDSLANQYKLDRLDVESAINLKLLDAIEIYDSNRGEFINLFRSIASRACIDLARRQSRESEYIADPYIECEETGELDEIYEIFEVAPTTTETHILNDIIKSRDQRQLIAALLEKADKPTKLTISAFLKSDNYREAAKLLGVSHVTVINRIKRLSRYYDEQQFGHPADYFTESIA